MSGMIKLILKSKRLAISLDLILCQRLFRAKRVAGSMDNDLVFHISRKQARDRGKAVQMNPIQPFLVTIVQWYASAQ